MKLTADQTQDLPFPVGCPVWYNFPAKTSSSSSSSSGKSDNENENGHGDELPLLKRGVVRSVSFNYSQSISLIYEVMYKADTEESSEDEVIIDEVAESQLAYGSNCPVVIADGNSFDSDGDCGHLLHNGTVLLSEPSHSEPGKFLYTVMILTEGTQARFERGVKAERVKYRKVESAIENVHEVTVQKKDTTENADPDNVQQKQQSPSNTKAHTDDRISPKISASVLTMHDPNKALVPSSITCDSNKKLQVEKSIVSINHEDMEEGEVSEHNSVGSSNKRKRGDPSTSNVPNADNDHKENSHIESMTSSNSGQRKCTDHGTGRDVSITSRCDNIAGGLATGTKYRTRLDISVPLWLQRYRSSQQDLFYYLIGTNTNRFRFHGNVSLNNIRNETNCSIRINYNPRIPMSPNDCPLAPITIIVNAHSSTQALQDLNDARLKLQDMLLDYIGNDGSKARLVYELAQYGFNCPSFSSSKAVKAKDPFGNGNCPFMTIQAIPFRSADGMLPHYHVAYLLEPEVKKRIWSETKAYFRVVGERFQVPNRLCEPYLLLSGESVQDVDKAAEILADITKKHIEHCCCTLP